jgi:hypothetical protein
MLGDNNAEEKCKHSYDGDLMRAPGKTGEKRPKTFNLDFVDWVLAIDCWPT